MPKSIRNILLIFCLGFFSLGLFMANPLNSQNFIIKDEFSIPEFENWKNADLSRAQTIRKFEIYLKSQKVNNVLPTYQILRTASSAKECNESAFYIPPRKLWPNIVQTLKFIKLELKPKLGTFEAVSGYRNPSLNSCAGGAKNSTHANYYALDLIPKSELTREKLIYNICKVHDKVGRKYHIGLGFYTGVRFHIDSRAYRRWGADGRSYSSPCGILKDPEKVPPPPA